MLLRRLKLHWADSTLEAGGGTVGATEDEAQTLLGDPKPMRESVKGEEHD